MIQERRGTSNASEATNESVDGDILSIKEPVPATNLSIECRLLVPLFTFEKGDKGFGTKSFCANCVNAESKTLHGKNYFYSKDTPDYTQLVKHSGFHALKSLLHSIKWYRGCVTTFPF